MAKTTTLQGIVKIKEASIAENLTNRILSIGADGTITDRPAISAGGTFISSVLPSAQIIVGNVSNVATAVAMSGVIAITNAGVTSIVDGSIVDADINASAAISYSKLNLATSIVNADVSPSAAIVYSKLNLAGGIVNADINSSAAIARSKIASGTAYRILANNNSGVLSENAALTAARLTGTDANGQLVSLTTTVTQGNFLAGTTSNVQDQFNNNILAFPASSLAKAPTASENGFALTWNDSSGEWDLTDPIIQGLTAGGNTGEFLIKLSGTNYDADWRPMVTSDISDFGGDVNDLNVLAGADAAGVTPAILGYLGGATPITSSVQQQINSKLSTSLSPGAIYYGSGGGVATQLAAATDGWVLTMVSGFPQWQIVAGTGTVTSVDVSGGSTGLTFSGGPVTTTGTITMAGTLDANNGGTGFSAYTVGDILYANTTSTLAKLGVGSDGEVLTLVAGVPAWDSSAAGVADGDYGDITVSGTGAVFTVDVDINKAWTGTHTFLDNNLSVLDNSDPTKILKFQVSGVTAGQTRTLTVPDLSGTIALLGASGNGAALTKTDDTNVTLTLGGDPNQALLTASSLTLGWTGQLAVTRGGTGLNTTSQGDILYADASNTLIALPKSATATRYLSNTGTSNNPAWAQINLTNGVTGVLPVANGGTGVSTGAWLQASGATLTANNTITMGGFSVSFLGGDLTANGTLSLTKTTNQLILGTTNTITITAPAPALSAVYTIPDVGTTGTFAMSAGATTFSGVKTFSSQINATAGVQYGTQTTPTIVAADTAGAQSNSGTGLLLRSGATNGGIWLYNVGGGGVTTGTQSVVNIIGTLATSAASVTRNMLKGAATFENTGEAGSIQRGVSLIPTINYTGGTTTFTGLHYEPAFSSSTGLTHYAIATASGLHGFGILAPTHQVHIKGTAADQNLFLVEENGGTNVLEIIEAAGVNKVGFFAAAPAAQQAGLTAITHTAPGTPDYALQDLTNVGGFGFVTKDEGNTLISVVKAMHDAMKAYGLLT